MTTTSPKMGRSMAANDPFADIEKKTKVSSNGYTTDDTLAYHNDGVALRL